LWKTGGKQLAKEATKRGFKPDMDTLKRLAQQAGIGGLEGAIYGAGTAEDVASIPKKAAEGAAWGAGGGAVLGEAMHQGRRYFQKQSALKDLIEERLAQGGDTSTALVKLQEDILTGGKKIVDDPIAIEAKAQGMDSGVIPSVKRATPLERTEMRKMTAITRDIIKDRELGMKIRPTDVVGDAMMRRFNIVLKANKDAGGQLDGVAKSLKGKSVDFSQAVGDFQTKLWDDLGVKLVTNKKGQVVPDFNPVVDIDPKTGEQLRKRSVIYGVKPAENIIEHLIGAMRQGKNLDAHDVHTLKKFIDEHVSWGTSGEGLSGKTLGIVKKLRTDFDAALDSKFSDYDAVNTSYKETIEVLDELQNIAGKQIDLTGERGKEALGQELRGLMSNRKRRVRLTNAIEGMEKVAVKYAGRQHDDIFRLALFADELDTMFPVVARTSLAGEVKKAVSNPQGAVLEKGADLLEDYQGINEDNAIKAIFRLIDSE
ncbi:MAG TPA: hypothetical protein VMV86_00840, partial [Methanosarcinales archaeon]|nr:hypothetical protein [Methanosarcinales archaeon]